MSEASPSAWRWWSDHASVRAETPSVMAIVETMLAVAAYWWLALEIGVLLPLLAGVAVAPLVLLRSERSVELGLRWFRAAETEAPGWTILVMLILIPIASYCLLLFASLTEGVEPLFRAIWVMAVPVVGYAVALGLASIVVRAAASVYHIGDGFRALPQNYRKLVICTSPMQVPELVPGLEATTSAFRFSNMTAKRVWFVLRGYRGGPKGTIASLVAMTLYYSVFLPIAFIPPWLYRVSIKSTAWFWWPLVFLGGPLRLARTPALLEWRLSGSLWARTSIAVSFGVVVGFLASNLLIDMVVLEKNPLLTPLGYLLLVERQPEPWQLCLLAGALLNLAVLYLVNDAAGLARIAAQTGAATLDAVAVRRFACSERMARIRTLCLLGYWAMVGGHLVLYVNSQQCWFVLGPDLSGAAMRLYGARMPELSCIATSP